MQDAYLDGYMYKAAEPASISATKGGKPIKPDWRSGKTKKAEADEKLKRGLSRIRSSKPIPQTNKKLSARAIYKPKPKAQAPRTYPTAANVVRTQR